MLRFNYRISPAFRLSMPFISASVLFTLPYISWPENLPSPERSFITSNKARELLNVDR